MRLIIADASCFILFESIDGLEILESTFKQIVTTDKVATECDPILPEWVEIDTTYNTSIYDKFSKRFGAGESSCFALAQESDNPLFLIDDRKARKVVEDVGIECVGCLGILLLAKREAVIKEVKPWLEKIGETDFRLTDDLVRTVLKLAKE